MRKYGAPYKVTVSMRMTGVARSFERLHKYTYAVLQNFFANTRGAERCRFAPCLAWTEFIEAP